MSLLNDMLKDIDKIKKKGEAEPSAAAEQKEQVKAKKLGNFILPVVAGLAAIYFIVVEMNLFGLMPTQKEVANVPPPAALNSSWLEKVEEIKAQKLKAGQTEKGSSQGAENQNGAELALTNSPSKAGQQHQKESEFSIGATANAEGDSESQKASMALVKLAHQAMSEGRLMAPEANNAFHLFSSALLLDSKSVSAKAGINDLKQKLSAVFSAKVQAGDFSSARSMLEKIKNKNIDESFALVLEKALLDTERRLANKHIEKQSDYRNSNTANDSALGEADRSNDAGSSRIDINVSDIDQDFSAKISSGSFYEVKDSALSWVLSNPLQSHLSQIALADAYAKQYLLPELSNLANALSKTSPAGSHYAKARALQAKGDLQATIASLKKHSFNGVADIYRQRLLAASYQSSKQYQKAMQVYQSVTRSPLVINSDWLGLAVSSDALKEFGTAYSAYRHFLKLGHSDERIVNYARQRAAELSLMMNTRG